MRVEGRNFRQTVFLVDWLMKVHSSTLKKFKVNDHLEGDAQNLPLG